MFLRAKHLQRHARPERPGPVFARMLQEPLGGQGGELIVMSSYLFQGWNCRGPQKHRDMILDAGTEEIGQVEMLATMIARHDAPEPLARRHRRTGGRRPGRDAGAPPSSRRSDGAGAPSQAGAPATCRAAFLAATWRAWSQAGT